MRYFLLGIVLGVIVLVSDASAQLQPAAAVQTTSGSLQGSTVQLQPAIDAQGQ